MVCSFFLVNFIFTFQKRYIDTTLDVFGRVMVEPHLCLVAISVCHQITFTAS